MYANQRILQKNHQHYNSTDVVFFALISSTRNLTATTQSASQQLCTQNKPHTTATTWIIKRKYIHLQ